MKYKQRWDCNYIGCLLYSVHEKTTKIAFKTKALSNPKLKRKMADTFTELIVYFYKLYRREIFGQTLKGPGSENFLIFSKNRLLVAS